MFKLQIVNPTAALRNFVQYYVVAEVSEPNAIFAVQKVFPMTLSGINFLDVPDMFLFTDKQGVFTLPPQIFLIGQTTTTRTNKFLRSGRIISAFFSPYGLYKFTGLDMSKIADQVFNASDILNASALKTCHQQMFECKSNGQAVDILEDFLLMNLDKKSFDLRGMDTACNFIRAKKGNIDIERLVDISCMSTKTFERHFSEKIGLTPKLFTRIVRFSNAMKMLRNGVGIFEILEYCGYTDQAHFIKEFKTFTGETPKQFYCGLQDASVLFTEHSIKE